MPPYVIRFIFLVFATFHFPNVGYTQSWEEAQESGEATIEIQWMTSLPFIYENKEGQLEGLEYELLLLFQEYLQKEKGITITYNWSSTEDFAGILKMAKANQNSNFLGVSAFSITEDREEYAQFSDPYLADVTVLVSSRGTKIVKTIEEMYEMMESMTAITIVGTNYEKLLLDLKDQMNLDFEIIYIKSDKNILDFIGADNNRFGFIDLPIYLMLAQNGGDLVRQNFYTVSGRGHGFLFTRDSDWDLPLNEFLQYAIANGMVSDLVKKYMGKEVQNFLENLYTTDEVGTTLLTKEKELQLELIKQANLQLKKEQSLKMMLVSGIIGAVFLLTAVGYLFYRNQKTTKLILNQKDEIFEQREDIQQKNEQLLNRNAQLLTLNEEKNDLMKILAHDIRSPLSQIMMIADILSNPKEEVDRDDFLAQISKSAIRINEMVTKILDVEGGEEESKILRERIDIRDILKDLSVRYKSVASKKSISFKTKTCENNFIIRTDHLLLTLVLENLVSNAIKFSSADSTVMLETDCKYDGVLFKVIDQGPGFSEEDKEKVFGRFQKLSAKPTGGEKSTGLGLSIVKKYVTDMGGEVWLESEEGKGTTFFVKIAV